MKKTIIFIFSALIALSAYSQTVMKIAGKKISKQEFEYYYHKNAVDDSTKIDFDEYTTRFINFKLKVQEAYSRQMDTVKSFQKELTGYREQLIQPYLTDQQLIDQLVDEQYERLQADVDVSHILFRVESNGDTVNAWKKVQEALKRLKKEKFEDVAATMSEDPSMNGGDGRIGWITGLNTVYPFEIAAYNTPIGGYSNPIRTMFGYHIIKVNALRPSRGQVKVAHIFKRIKEDFTQNQKDSLKNVVYNIYNDLKAGKIDFSDAASKYSDDGNARNGGVLPWITTGKTNELFENAAFSLQNPNDISEPIEASYGWHIIMLIEKKPLDSKDEMKKFILSRMKGDERASMITDSFINKLKLGYNFKVVNSGDTLATFADVALTKDDLNKFLEKNTNIGADTLDVFFNSTLYDYENKNLENKYPEFGLLMKEYKDGILMFNISQIEIWNKAAKDTAGLRRYFIEHKDKYQWDAPRYKGIIVHCVDKNTMKRAKKMLKTTTFESAYDCLVNLNIDGKKYVKLERGVFAEGKNPYVDYFIFKKGSLPENKKYPESFVTGKLINAPETYKDIKGPVLSDYQSVVEAEWIKRLQAKYPVEIYSDVLKTVK
ncbi:MAG: peptidylprolyl isomerase [Paludibacteraceae bacterium]|nr:peptidylprolyl isomerase [Paludibacteraceae bacterium]